MRKKRHGDAEVHAFIRARKLHQFRHLTSLAIAGIVSIQRLELDPVSPRIKGRIRPGSQIWINVQPEVSHRQVYQRHCQPSMAASDIENEAFRLSKPPPEFKAGVIKLRAA